MEAIQASILENKVLVQDLSVFSDQENSEALHKLLDELRDASTSEREKGTLFEELCLLYFAKDKKYSDQISHVQLYSDWAAENNKSAQDTGIDLVLTLKPDENGVVSFAAVQCKFYDEGVVVSKKDIDSFANASDKPYFTQRYIVASNSKFTDNVRRNLAGKNVPIQIITLSDLEQSDIDWSSLSLSQVAGFRKLRDDQIHVQSRKLELRPYQKEAINAVLLGLKDKDRGKLIMACGTGKTLTALGICTELIPSAQSGSLVAFLVPSLSLLSQTLTSWKHFSPIPINAFAVCSDSSVGKKQDDLNDFITSSELNYPATTDAKKLAEVVKFKLQESANIADPKQRPITVIFATYQSIGVIIEAQHNYNLPEIYLTICDEAHRTTGCYSEDQGSKSSSKKIEEVTELDKIMQRLGISTNSSVFSLVHDNRLFKSVKRLYMTATPKIFVDRGNKRGRGKASNDANDVEVFSMDDQSLYGPTLHVLNFSKAVELGCLTDYKVLILAVDQSMIPHSDEILALDRKNCAKIVGTWKALNKYGVRSDLSDDSDHMKRAVIFAQVIDSNDPKRVASKKLTAHFQEVVDSYNERVFAESQLEEPDPALVDEINFLNEHPLVCECRHIDGHQDAVEKSDTLAWLKAPTEENKVKLLFNVRCLSEGVDVPSLDAIAFFSPRSSEVDVVQSVGRVMRRAPNKQRGYVIVPIVTKDPDNPEKVFEINEEFQIIWKILNALKSLNPDREIVDGRLNKLDEHIQIVCMSNKVARQKSSGSSGNSNGSHGETISGGQTTLFDLDEATMTLTENIKAAIIKKMGNSKAWEEWAKDVGQICQDQVNIITKHINESASTKEIFESFRQELSVTLRNDMSEQEVLDMLGQHIVVKPVLDELFSGFPFTEKNPIAHALTKMMEVLDKDGMIRANKDLQSFYDSVAQRMSNVQTLDERQKVIVDLFDKFFKVAFPKQQEKLGIVYTPVEVVDFMNRSVNDLLKREFGQCLAAPNVHVLDPFTGTGTFLTRMLLNPDLIPDSAIKQKYTKELHAFELMPLAYYVASINMEAAYAERTNQTPEEYESNNITVLTDTFANKQDINYASDVLTEQNQDLEKNALMRDCIDKLPIQVIIGNPPYSAGQKSQNDDNQNESYPALEERLAQTYVKKAGDITNKNSLYDSYIKAFRWGADQIKDHGVLAFISNAGWLDSVAACGMRRCLQEEFSSIYVYHLKGNQRSTFGELSHKEGGQTFGSGCRAPIAITFLVKNPQADEQGKIFFGCVDDYLSREEKLASLVNLGSIINAPLTEIIPDEHGDWLNQRSNDYSKFISMDGKNQLEGIFSVFSNGVKTNRDPWSYNASRLVVAENFTRCINFYNSQVEERILLGDSFEQNNDATMIKWERAQVKHLKQNKHYKSFSSEWIISSLYRPFFKESLYFDKDWVCNRYQLPKLFPFDGAENLVICMSGSAATDFMPLMSNIMCDIHVLDSGTQCFPRYKYRPVEDSKDRKWGTDMHLLAVLEDPKVNHGEVVINGYVREDAIKPEAVDYFKQVYLDHGDKIDADSVFYYIYGVLHSEEYRSSYANNLQKELPRIPRVATYEDFTVFEQAGRKLADLHINYEKVVPYDGCHFEEPADGDYTVQQMVYGKIDGKKGNAAKDKSVIIYNDKITISNIPLEAQEYVVNKKSALDWLVERCCVTQDKSSGIVNDYNLYAKEIGDDKYIFNLILRVITVSLETVKIVKNLPKLDIHPMDKKAESR